MPACAPSRKGGEVVAHPGAVLAILRWLAGQEPSSVFATTITQAKLLNEEFADRILYLKKKKKKKIKKKKKNKKKIKKIQKKKKKKKTDDPREGIMPLRRGYFFTNLCNVALTVSAI